MKDGKAWIIAGISGTGKSSLAAVLVRRGYPLLADDVSVIGFQDNEPVVYPGIPHLKLWYDVMKKLGEDPAKHPKVQAPTNEIQAGCKGCLCRQFRYRFQKLSC